MRDVVSLTATAIRPRPGPGAACADTHISREPGLARLQGGAISRAHVAARIPGIRAPAAVAVAAMLAFAMPVAHADTTGPTLVGGQAEPGGVWDDHGGLSDRGRHGAGRPGLHPHARHAELCRGR